MKKVFFAFFLSLGLAACGGGGGASGDSSAGLNVSAEAFKAKTITVDSTLAAQAVSIVNTTTTGDQVVRSAGALADGGYMVAWLSGTTLFIQRYDNTGAKVGGEVAVPVVIQDVQSPGIAADPQASPANALRESSVAVLRDGSVVVAYEIDRFVSEVGAFFQFKEGIYFQRFDANGVQLTGETEVYSQLALRNSRPVFLDDPKIVALADGGFTIAWNNLIPALTVTSKDTLYKQRFDSQARPVGGVVTVGQFLELGHAGFPLLLEADAFGGYTLTATFRPDFLGNPPLTTAIHFDAADAGTEIVAPRPGPVLLLPLEGGRFVLFGSDSSGPFRQFLDAAGNPVGAPVPLASMPVAARELVDGTFVVFRNTSGSVTAQRYDSSGAAMGNVLTLGSGGILPLTAALADGGIAAAWSAPGTGGDLEVFTQRFIEVVTPDEPSVRTKRKACLDSARGMHGHERKAFMEACLKS